jgi:hypothetical protein
MSSLINLSFAFAILTSRRWFIVVTIDSFFFIIIIIVILFIFVVIILFSCSIVMFVLQIVTFFSILFSLDFVSMPSSLASFLFFVVFFLSLASSSLYGNLYLYHLRSPSSLYSLVKSPPSTLSMQHHKMSTYHLRPPSLNHVVLIIVYTLQ